MAKPQTELSSIAFLKGTQTGPVGFHTTMLLERQLHSYKSEVRGHLKHWHCDHDLKWFANIPSVVPSPGVSSPPSESSVVYSSVGSSVTLPCVFTEGLVQHSGIWERRSTTRSSTLSLPSSFRSPLSGSTQDRSAWIETVEDGDEGIYTCSGMMKLVNTERKAQRSMQLVVARGKLP